LQEAGRFCQSSHQKPHLVQPPTVKPKHMTHATMVSRLNTQNPSLARLYIKRTKARERQNR
jgi:hypothetical protein